MKEFLCKKTITMKTFGVAREENKKINKAKNMIILSIICHRYFDTNHFITWFVYFHIVYSVQARFFFKYSMEQRPEFFSNFGWPDYLFYYKNC
jgi:hypothetical protein